MSDLKAEIAGRDKKFGECFTAGDFDGLANLYTEDAYVMPTGSETIQGKEAVKTLFSTVKNAGAQSLEIGPDEVGIAGGDVVYERGHYHFKKADGTTFQVGKFVVLWKRVNGVLHLYTDIFNANTK